MIWEMAASEKLIRKNSKLHSSDRKLLHDIFKHMKSIFEIYLRRKDRQCTRNRTNIIEEIDMNTPNAF